MVHQVLQRFGFQFSSPQPTPLSTSHSLSTPPSDESVEPSGPYPELVGCLMYLMTCTRPNLAYPLSLLARYVAPGRHRKVHWDAAKRVLRYLCSTSGMGLVLGGRGPVVLTGHADASWKPPAELILKWIDEAWADVPEEMVRKAFLTCGISNAEDGSQDHLILVHMRDSGEVEMEEEAVLAAEAEEADEEAVPAKSDWSESDDGNANEADEWSDEGDEWWAPSRYEGAEVEEWVAGDEDE
ncbi:unnamed protein product [Closterium sp. NIES-54]